MQSVQQYYDTNKTELLLYSLGIHSKWLNDGLYIIKKSQKRTPMSIEYEV